MGGQAHFGWATGGRVGHLTVRRSKACQGTLGKMLDPKALRYR